MVGTMTSWYTSASRATKEAMRKKNFLLLGGVLLAGITLSACSLPLKKAAQPKAEKMTIEQQMQQLADLYNQGASARCTLSVTENGQVMNSEFIMKDKKVKATVHAMTTPSQTEGGEPKETVAYILTDDAYSYLWSDEDPQGMKVTIPEEQRGKDLDSNQLLPDLANDETRAKLEEKGFTVHCEEAAVDDSELVPPSDKEFVDYQAQMQQMMQQQEGNK